MKKSTMERIQPMNELQIQQKVEDLAGKSAKILDCEQNTMNQTEEILLVNGIPISLVGDEGTRIKEALIHGEVPPCDLVNGMLIRAGIETNPVELETTMNVKTSAKILEHSTLLDRNGVLVDEKMREKEDQDEFNTVNVEVWRTEQNNPTVENKNKNKVVGGTITEQLDKNKNSTPKKVDNNSSSLKKKFKGFTTNTSTDKGHKQDKSSSDNGTATDPETTTTKSSKKHNIFSNPTSIIMKGNKNDSKGKSKNLNQKHNQQQPIPAPPEITKISTTPQKQQSPQPQPPVDNNNVPKNKFLSLFSKGKTKDKSNKESAEKTTNTTTTNKSSKNKSGGVNNKNILLNENQQARNRMRGVDSKIDHGLSLTKKQNINVNYLDPSLSLVHVEIDGIPVRVTYETFV